MQVKKRGSRALFLVLLDVPELAEINNDWCSPSTLTPVVFQFPRAVVSIEGTILQYYYTSMSLIVHIAMPVPVMEHWQLLNKIRVLDMSSEVGVLLPENAMTDRYSHVHLLPKVAATIVAQAWHKH